MTVQLSPDQEKVLVQALETGNYSSIDEVLESAIEAIRQSAGIPPSLTRSQLAGQRIRELRKGLSSDGISIKELIEDGRE